ncbi:MAG: asparagine synthase (glutamine-hydrolyzing) [Bacteroidota bacterium]
MCGIVGILGSTSSVESTNGLVSQMLRVQSHRGPDATGKWSADGVCLGHNRLSIIDLSESANQPMVMDDLVMVFNGEVYNYVEIRKELEGIGHRFSTQSDSEVIMHAYQEWGSSCVDRFVGMWAFAIWDSKRKRLFASRDRFGIKPFHYIFKNGEFHFASEIKTLRLSPHFSSSLNISQVARGLQMGWICYHDETYFECVKSIPAGHNLFFEDGSLEIKKYWEVSSFEKYDLSYVDKVSAFRELFFQSIKLHLRSDVPVASCLSGGIDSSAIVSSIATLNSDAPYNTFSIYYEGQGDVDERPFVNEVIRKFPKIYPYFFQPNETDVADVFDHALYHCDSPATGSSFISQYFLMRLISQNGIKVVLDGQGADEYLGGYMHTYYRLIGSMLTSMNIQGALQTSRTVNRQIGSSLGKSIAHFGKSILAGLMSEQSLYRTEFSNYYPFLVNQKFSKVPFELSNKGASKVDCFLNNLLFTTSLPSLLHYEDRNSMAFSIESRVPFLDHRLVEFAFALRDSDRVDGVTTKRILRDAMKRVIPDAIYNRRDKKGFVTPGESKWLRGPLRFLTDGLEQRLPDFIDKKKACSVIEDYRNGRNDQASLVWRLAVFCYWMNK